MTYPEKNEVGYQYYFRTGSGGCESLEDVLKALLFFSES